MARMIFVNLPVKDVAKSTAFYPAIGFTRDPRFGNDVASAMNGSDGITLMILGHDFHRSSSRTRRSPTLRRDGRVPRRPGARTGLKLPATAAAGTARVSGMRMQ